MQEVSGSFEDTEKRVAIFFGLVAVLLISLGCLVTGADMDSFLIRGLVGFTLSSLAAWWLAHQIGPFLKKAEPVPVAETSPDADVTVITRDAPVLPKFEAPKPVVIPADEASPRVLDFVLPELGDDLPSPRP
jgi:hypothetical protein